MVSPGKGPVVGGRQRPRGHFADLQALPDTGPAAAPSPGSKTRSGALATSNQRKKYTDGAADDEPKRLRRLIEQVKQALVPFAQAVSAQSGPPVGLASVPAATTIMRFLEKIAMQHAEDPTAADLEVGEFRKVLYALGLTAEDSALLLEALDPEHVGRLDPMRFRTTFGSPQRHGIERSSTSKRLRATSTTIGDDRAAQNLHQRAIERALIKFPNLKDAFRQYDTTRTGVLSQAQFRTFMRDLNIVGREAELLARYLDPGNQQCVSFHAFARATAEQGYGKSPSKPMLKKANGVAAVVRPLDEDDQDPMERIRSLLRQRVMGRSKSIREVFMEFDADGNGYLDHEEFRSFMASYQFNVDETNMTICFLDQDGSGTIDYDEFAAGLLFYRAKQTLKATPTRKLSVATSVNTQKETPKGHHGDYVLEAVRSKLISAVESKTRKAATSNQNWNIRDEFAKFDNDGTQSLDRQEFAAFLVGMGIKLDDDDLQALFMVIDADGSDQINYDEFARIFAHIKGVDDRMTDALSTSDVHGRASNESRKSMRAMFDSYDADRSGFLDVQEFSELMRDHGFSEDDIAAIFEQMGKESLAKGIDFLTFEVLVANRKWRKHSPPKKAVATSSHATDLQVSETMLLNRILRDHHTLEQAFRQHDLDGSGELEHDEFRRFMKHYGIKDEKAIDRLIRILDVDSSGSISVEEFLAHFDRKKVTQHSIEQCHQKEKPSNKLGELERVWMEEVLEHHSSMAAAFQEFDRDGRGVLEYEQFRDLLGQYGISDDSNVRRILSLVDTDKSGTVSLEEFLAVFDPSLCMGSTRKKARAPYASKQSHDQASTITRRRRIETEQAKAHAVRLRLLEEQWMKAALSRYPSIAEAFDAFDSDKSGELDHSEFKNLMVAFGIEKDDDIAALITKLDLDVSGTIEFEEFATIFNERRLRRPHLTPVPSEDQSKRLDKVKTKMEAKSSNAARMRILERKWVERVLGCHQSIEAAFREYDRDGNGELDHEEFTHFMKRYGIVHSEDIAWLIKRLDTDSSGTIDFEEFSTVFDASICERQAIVDHANDDEIDPEELESILEIERVVADRIMNATRDLRLAFKKFDLNGNGKLEYKEFRAVLKSYKFPEREIRKVIRHLDRDVSGYIDYKEFIAGFKFTKDSQSNANVVVVHALPKRKQPNKRASVGFG